MPKQHFLCPRKTIVRGNPNCILLLTLTKRALDFFSILTSKFNAKSCLFTNASNCYTRIIYEMKKMINSKIEIIKNSGKYAAKCISSFEMFCLRES